MEQLIFFAVIIFFSIVESIARSRKARAQREQGGGSEPEPQRFPWAQNAPREVEPASYDADPSYDDAVSGIDEAAARTTPPRREPTREELAAEIWAEISGLAAGKQAPGRRRDAAPPRQAPQVTRRAPPPLTRQSAPLERNTPELDHRSPPPSPGQADRVGRMEVHTKGLVVPVRPPPAPEHRVRQSHSGYGTDPSERLRSEQDGLDPLAEHLGSDAAAVRRQLRGGSLAELRRAVILEEVLNPPVSLRE